MISCTNWLPIVMRRVFEDLGDESLNPTLLARLRTVSISEAHVRTVEFYKEEFYNKSNQHIDGVCGNNLPRATVIASRVPKRGATRVNNGACICIIRD